MVKIQMKLQSLPDEEVLYQAVIERDTAHQGLFFFGVKTTGIFCRPGCHARPPLRQNIDYFDSIQAALNYGYRPCKLCSPLSKPGETPGWLKALLDDVHVAPERAYKDYDLRQRGLDPTRVRRWFLRHHGMTFHAYIKALRINRAFKKMKNNETVTSVAFDSGYDSLSGFQQAFKNITGLSPTQTSGHTLVNFSHVATPLGPMVAAASERGLCLLEFGDRKQIDVQIAQLRGLLQAIFVKGENGHLKNLEIQLDEYFGGKRRRFDLPLDLAGTAFQLEAWRALQTIPYGQTRSYLDQARAIGRDKAVRAVASANAKNRIAIVIPCHRVIAKNGSLAGFGGGVWRKKYLLDLESSSDT